MLIAMTEAGQESRVRKLATRRGFAVQKSRDRTLHMDNCGQYMLIDINSNMIVLGEKFDASLSTIEAYLEQQ